MNLRIKTLKIVNDQNVRDSIAYLMQYRLNKWWVPRQMQACLLGIGVRKTEIELHEIMYDLFEQSKDNPGTTFDARMFPQPRFRCTAYFSPNKNLNTSCCL